MVKYRQKREKSLLKEKICETIKCNEEDLEIGEIHNKTKIQTIREDSLLKENICETNIGKEHS